MHLRSAPAAAAAAPATELYEAVRGQFPSLAAMEETGEVMFENAGGSQLPLSVIDAVRDYMLTTYVQLGAPYGRSETAGSIVQAARDFATVFVGGEGLGECYLGPSSTACCVALAVGACCAPARPPPTRPPPPPTHTPQTLRVFLFLQRTRRSWSRATS